MQMEYRDCVINLLDTPGHKDFSEDTYRVLTAVDAALMVIDAANGVEAQTLRLLEVCRSRDTPIITFINKMDREVREPLELIDEIERVLEMPAVPFTWPVGMGKRFGGVFDIRANRMRVFRAGRRPRAATTTRSSKASTTPTTPSASATLSTQAKNEIELVQGASPEFDRDRVSRGPADAGLLRLGDQQLRRARNARRADRSRAPAGAEGSDPAHRRADRDEIHRRRLQDPGEHGPRAPRPRRFRARVLGPLRARHAAEDQPQRQGPAHQQRGVVPLAAARPARRSLSRRRDRHPQSRRAPARRHAHRRREAPVHRAAVLRAGDFLYRRARRSAARASSFAPGSRSSARKARSRCSGRTWAARCCSARWGSSSSKSSRIACKHEYGVDARSSPARHKYARWVTCDDERELKRFIDNNAHRIAYDVVEAPTFLAGTRRRAHCGAGQLAARSSFHALREHAGLVFQTA